MKHACLLLLLLPALGRAQPPPLQLAVDAAVKETCAECTTPALKPDQLGVTVVDLRGPTPVRASYRGGEKFYPASVIKLFFLAYAHRLMEDGKLADTPELRRGMRDMIVDSYNEATSYVVDAVTGTTSGPELPAAELAVWHEKRGVVTRYFQGLGYPDVNAQRKPWGEGPYGREKQDLTANPPARNFLTTNDTARLLEEIATGHCVTPARSAQMLELMARDPFTPTKDPDDQATGFTGPALSPGMKLWSKAGWVSWARHDAALIELPGGGRVIIVVFTDGREHANNRVIIPAVVRRILACLPQR
ncbi:MAG: serine hydrolase [bacterium]|nr:serine hydrolase [bacterium]MDI1337163.1 serine hydrolase [Lacunisphaera sp.]